ncbi:MAG: hypothetical protein ISS89_05395 [Candidatus Omnitrophica bacterium]|nr:hypothetical protein [Candidatus Omnitrophota bacterium]
MPTDTIIIFLSSATLFLLIIQIIWNWRKSRPKLTIENLRIHINNIRRQGADKELNFDIRFDIKNHSTVSNSIVKFNLSLKEPAREHTNLFLKNRTIQGKTTEGYSMYSMFVIPNVIPKKEYDFIITLFDQHNKSYSGEISVPTPELYRS